MQTILLVRHADIDLPPASSNPPLNSAGRTRAKALAHAVGSAGVTAVFISSFLRTKETVEPLVTRLGLGSSEVPSPAIFAARVVNSPAGSVFVVAGHSNTVPAMITALHAGQIQPILEGEFDNLFVVTVEAQRTRLMRLKYGRPST